MDFQLKPKGIRFGYQDIVDHMRMCYIEMYVVVRKLIDENPDISKRGTIDILPKIDVDKGLDLVGDYDQIGTRLYELYLVPMRSVIMTITREFLVSEDLSDRLARYLFLIDDFANVHRRRTAFGANFTTGNDMIHIGDEFGLITIKLRCDLEMTLLPNSSGISHVIELPIINTGCTRFKLSQDVEDLVSDDYWIASKVMNTDWCSYLSLSMRRNLTVKGKDKQISLFLPAGTILGSFDFEDTNPF